jgi:hypothetical protein
MSIPPNVKDIFQTHLNFKNFWICEHTWGFFVIIDFHARVHDVYTQKLKTCVVCAVHSTAQHSSTALHCTALHCTAQHSSTSQHCNALRSTACTAQHSTAAQQVSE